MTAWDQCSLKDSQSDWVSGSSAYCSAVRRRSGTRSCTGMPAFRLKSSPLTSLILARSEEHTSELQSLMRISYAVFCLKKKNNTQQTKHNTKKYVAPQTL